MSSSRAERLFRSTSFRLAAAQSAVFALLVAALGAGTLLTLRHANDKALDEGLIVQADRLAAVRAQSGVAGLTRAIEVLQHATDDWELRLSDAAGTRLAGDLPDAKWPQGLATRVLVEGDRPGGEPETIRAFTVPLSGGLRVTVGRDLQPSRHADAAAVVALVGLLFCVLGVGLGLGVVVGRRVLRRIDEMDGAITAYAAGDSDARVKVGRWARSDLDVLAVALNRMLDRTTDLTDGLRRVSASVAHDLRRPLARHNQEIARALVEAPDPAALKAALVAASERVDEVLSLFQAMLQLAELQAGAPGLPRTSVDLHAVAQRVVEAYLPAAEDGGRELRLSGAPHALVVAEDRVLGRLVANLVENGLTHTPRGACVEVHLDPIGPKLLVSDDGPGVPATELNLLFQPFHRLDASRGTPGSGLGLALVAAAAKAFGARVLAEDARPGLRITVDFTVSP